MQESNATPRRGGARPGAGRPKRAPTLAAALRDAFPVERLVEIAEKMIASDSDEVRFRTLMQIFDRCHGKVADKLELSRGDDAEPNEDQFADQMTDAELDALDELDARKAEILAAARDRRALPAG
jgi:predicted HAD superfamily Cof-like phosphohydrolase